MHNRNLFFIFLASTIVSVASIHNYGYSQSTSTSPYSSFGLGEREGMDHGVYLGMGNTTITYVDSTTLNFFNPASYSNLAKGQPLFSTGVSSRISKYTEGQNTNFSKTVLLNHFALGFSFAEHFGLTVGLKPFSRRGYSFQTTELLGSDSIKHAYEGIGSSNEIFMGFSSHLIKLKKYALSVGANTGYVFGTLTNERRSNLVGSTYGGVDQNSLRLAAFHYEVGLYFKHEINQQHAYSVSAVVEPQQTFKAFQQSDLFKSSFVENPLYYVKLDSTGSVQGTITIAPSTTLGLNYTFSFKDVVDSKTRNSELSFHGSFNRTTWAVYKSTFSGVENNPGYANTSKLTFGVQYTPETSFTSQSANSTFIEKLRFRVGGYQYTLPIIVDDLSLKDQAITFGIGIPVGVQKSLSSVNLGVAFGTRGNGSSEGLNERYYGVNLSFVFAPASFERWFVKRKFD